MAAMFRQVRRGLPDPAALFRRVHEAWLTRAVTSGKAYPRIPVRRVDEGGFDPLLSRPGGRQLADRWWSAALGRVDE
jgi:hypothetical protein